MNELLIYLLKSAGVLSLFYLVYQMLLKNDTGFRRNRIFLLSGMLVAAVIPVLSFTQYVSLEIPAYLYEFQSATSTENLMKTNRVDWWEIGGIIYLGIFGLLFFRLIFQLFSILKLIATSTKTSFGHFIKIETSQEISPFSFFNILVFNPKIHPDNELNLILKHEKVHARQKHSIDILLANFLTAVLWFNPLSWLYKKDIEQNLEFLADRDATQDIAIKTAYQKALVNTTIRGFTPVLSNNFYQSSIKKRIIMLNKKTTSKNNLWKMTLIFPLLFAFMFLFNVKVQAQVNPEKTTVETQTPAENPMEESLIVVNGEIKDANFDINSISPNEIASVNVLKGKKALEEYGEKGVIEITLKKGESNLNKQSEVSSFAFYVSEEDLKSNQILYVIDGKIMKKDFNANSIEKEDIAFMTILKGEKAIDKYGEKAKNGVIEIMLKKNKDE